MMTFQPNKLARSSALLALCMAFSVLGLEPSALAVALSELASPQGDPIDNALMLPYSGAAPNFNARAEAHGTRIVIDFFGSQTPHQRRILLDHPLPSVSRMEMVSLGDKGAVRVTLTLVVPTGLAVLPDPLSHTFRLQLGDDLTQGQFTNQPAQQMAPRPQRAKAPARMPAPPRVYARMPEASPSTSPVALQEALREPTPGTPDSGSYVYRKAISSQNGQHVTEVQVRTTQQSALQVHANPDTRDILVNVTQPDSQALNNEGSDGTPWYLSSLPASPTFKALPSIDTLLGYTLMSENAPTFGTQFQGAGATLWGFSGDLPLTNDWSLHLGGESFSYHIASTQVPDANFQRNQYFLNLEGTYLPIRSPWVLAVGPGYWLRYLSGNSANALPPDNPSMMFPGNLLEHGPSLGAHAFYPLIYAVGLSAEVSAAPYLFGGSDSLSAALGPLYGYEGALGLKWGYQSLSLGLRYRYQGFGNYGSSYSANRGGPEVSAVWRF
jgi:hypothetical protein